jgi:outer membrane protein assembly factor BamD (BamD/ComL family)
MRFLRQSLRFEVVFWSLTRLACDFTVSVMVKHVRIILFLLCLLSSATVAFSANTPSKPAAPERKDAFSKHWWERLKPSAGEASEQLELANSLREEGRLRAATREYKALVYNWPKSPEAPAAQLNCADCLDRRGLYEEAFEAYQFLVDIYAGFFSFDEVVARQSAIAWKIARRKRWFLFISYTRPEDAIPFFEKLVKDCPYCDGVHGMQFEIGKISEQSGEYDLAIDAYQRYLRIFPDGDLADDAAFRLAECYYHLARKNPNDKDLNDYARSSFDYYLARYPNGEFSAQSGIYSDELQMTRASAYYNEAITYEKNAGRTRNERQVRLLMTAAKTVYERLMSEFPDSRWVDVARARLEHVNQTLEKKDE